MNEVWSCTVWDATPRREYGLTTIAGTRKPKLSSMSSGTGDFGGGTWSKKPPHSSYRTTSAVLSQAGLCVSASTTKPMNFSPSTGSCGG